MSLALVLHSHLPWLRRNGTYPVGEEWLFQSWSEAYLPLLDVLGRVAADGGRDLLTLGITPVLAEQMDDPYLLGEFHSWLGRRLLDLHYSITRYGGPDRERLTPVWRDHWQRQTRILSWFEERYRDGLATAFRRLADAGAIQLLGGPATHPYLPLMDDPGLITGQIDGGLTTFERVLGTRPTGVWTPECAYRPAGPVADPTRPPMAAVPGCVPQLHPSGATLPGLEEFWAAAGATHLVLDGPTLARAAGAPDQDWAGCGGRAVAPGGPLDVLDRPVWVGDADVAAFGRNLAVSYAVWNPHGGYPADPAYRDFHRLDLEGGFKSWRVTDRGSWDKEPYDPVSARERAVGHARAFLALVERHLAPRGPDAVVVAAYDTELFGHWWHEGPVWLEAVLRRLLDGRAARRPTTLARHLEHHPPQRRLALPESSWGAGKRHGSWAGESTRWVWQALRDAEARFRGLAPGPARDAAWRQLTLLQASDWPFLITRDQATRYATERLTAHLARFAAACRGEDLAALAARDDPLGTPAPLPSPTG